MKFCKTRISKISLIVILILSVSMVSRADETAEMAVRYALETFNPTVTPEERVEHVKYFVNNLLAEEQLDELKEVYAGNYESDSEKKAALQKTIAKYTPVNFITLKDNTTYWSCPERGQIFDWYALKHIKGNYEGQRLKFTKKDLFKNMISIEMPPTHDDYIIFTRKDGKRFVLEDPSTYYTNADIYYKFKNIITGKSEKKNLFTFFGKLKLIVFGLQRPKMNPDTKKVFPPDYIYDPYDGTTLVPVEWSGFMHKSKP